MHCTTLYEGSEINRDQAGAVDQLDHLLFGFGVVARCKDDSTGFVWGKVLSPGHRHVAVDLTSHAPTGSTRPRPRRPSHEIAISARLRGTSFKSALPGRQIGSRTWSGAGRGVSSDETKLELGSVDRRVAGFPGIGLQKKIRPLPVRQGLALTSDFEEVVIPGLKSFS